MKTLYVLTDGNTYMKEAYTCEDRAMMECDMLNFVTGQNFRVSEVLLPFIGRSVSYIEIYRGYDYNFRTGKMFDNIKFGGIYACNKHAKESSAWIEFEKIAKANPDNHSFTETMIASKDCYGNTFDWGDVMDGHFNMQIKRIRVIHN